MNHCSQCGETLIRGVPPGDDRERYICPACGIVHYENPRMVVGCIPQWQGRVLLCRRSIDPRRGTWTVPAGYLENGESVEHGTQRELTEEACASASELLPYGLYNIRHVNQVYLIFIARLASEEFGPGEESLEVRLFDQDAIPWEELAFPVVEMVLRRYFEDAKRGAFPFHIGDVTRRMRRAD